MFSRVTLQVSLIAVVIAPQAACSQRTPTRGDAAITEALIRRPLPLKLRERLTRQFATMDVRVAAYKATQDFLTQQVEMWTADR